MFKFKTIQLTSKCEDRLNVNLRSHKFDLKKNVLVYSFFHNFFLRSSETYVRIFKVKSNQVVLIFVDN